MSLFVWFKHRLLSQCELSVLGGCVNVHVPVCSPCWNRLLQETGFESLVLQSSLEVSCAPGGQTHMEASHFVAPQEGLHPTDCPVSKLINQPIQVISTVARNSA